jgi:hypothetical protein
VSDFDIDVIVDDKIVESEKGADAQVDAHAWIQEARALPSRIGTVAPPLTDIERMMVDSSPDYQKMLNQRTKVAQLDAINKTLSKMPKPEDVAGPLLPTAEPELSYGDQLDISNTLGMLNLGLTQPVITKMEGLLNQIARDPSPSPKAPLLRALLPLKGLELKTHSGQTDYDTLMRFDLVAMRAEDLMRSSRTVILERASQALEIERYNLEAMREDVEEHGDWHAPKNVRARLQAPKPMPSQRRQEAEDRRAAREQKKLDEQARAQARAAGMNILE